MRYEHRIKRLPGDMTMTPEEILADFSSQNAFPSDAMAAAGANREAMIPVFLDQIERLLSDKPGSFDDTDVSTFLFVYFLLGEWRDSRAYRPLVALLRQDPDFVDMLIGDAVTEGTARVIAGVCDGDLQPIFTVIGDSAADEFVRAQMIDALVIIAHAHLDKKPEVEAFLTISPRLTSRSLTFSGSPGPLRLQISALRIWSPSCVRPTRTSGSLRFHQTSTTSNGC